MTSEGMPSRPADCSRVNLEDVWAVLYWVQELNCSESELREAVRAAGPRSDQVRAHLERCRLQGLI